MKLKLLVLACLLVLLGDVSLGRMRRATSIDFYQLWGVQQAVGWRDQLGTDPYRDQAGYAKALNEFVDRSGDPQLLAASEARRQSLRLTGTPFFYWVFALLPGDFLSALITFRSAQFLCLLAAVIFLARRFGTSWLDAAMFGTTICLLSHPFQADVRVGNVNAFQLLALVALGGVGAKNHSALLATAGALALFKPNLAAVALLLVAHVAAIAGARRAARAVAIALIVAVLLAIAASVWFGSWTAWLDWFRMLYGNPVGATSVGAAPPPNNRSTVQLMMRFFGIRKLVAIAAISALLGTTFFAACTWAVRRRQPAAVRVLDIARAALSDRTVAISIGVVALCALSPLVWQHYYTLLLFPAVWLVADRSVVAAAGWCGAVALLATSSNGVPGGIGHSLANATLSMSWAPLWIGLLLRIATSLPTTSLPAAVRPAAVRPAAPASRRAGSCA